MINYKKIMIFVFCILCLFNSVWSLTIVENQQTQGNNVIGQQQEQSFMSKIPWAITGWMALIGFVIALVLYIIFRTIWWLYKKLNDDRKKVDDLEYYKYTLDLKMVRLNANRRFKYKRAWTWFLFWKKAPVYAQTEFGRKFLGYYEGEAVKKEEYFIFGLEMRHSFFNRETDVVIMPYKLRKYLIKYNDDFSIDIQCEGIDEVMSSEYYSIPIIKNYGTDKSKIFVDFSNDIIENFYKKYVFRDVIKTMTNEYKDGVKDAVEMNPAVQMDRKTGGSLKG